MLSWVIICANRLANHNYLFVFLAKMKIGKYLVSGWEFSIRNESRKELPPIRQVMPTQLLLDKHRCPSQDIFLPLMRLTKFIIDEKMSISQFFKETRCDSKRQTIFGGSILRDDFIPLIFIRYTHLKQSDYFYNLTITTKGKTKTYLYTTSKKNIQRSSLSSNLFQRNCLLKAL